MILTHELLGERIKTLEAQKAQMIANVNAVEGGLMVARGLLSDLDREENEDTGEQVTEPAPFKEKTDG